MYIIKGYTRKTCTSDRPSREAFDNAGIRIVLLCSCSLYIIQTKYSDSILLFYLGSPVSHMVVCTGLAQGGVFVGRISSIDSSLPEHSLQEPVQH